MRTRFLPALLCLISIHALEARDVTSLVQKYADLKPAPGRAAANFEVSVGHARFTVAQGNVVPVLAGEEAVGLFLTNGTFTYETVNVDELAAVRYNAKHGDLPAASVEGKVTISTPFRSALLLGNGLPTVTSEGVSVDKEWSDNRAVFGRNDFSVPAGHLLAFRDLDSPKSRVIHSEVHGNDRSYLYIYDDAYNHEEKLLYLRKPQSRGGRLSSVSWQTLVSRQAVGRANREIAPARVRLVDVDVDVVGNMDESGQLKVIETLVPQQRPAEVLRFTLTKYLYYDFERPPRVFNLRSVKDGRGRELSFVHDADDLLVSLAEPAPAGRPFTLTFEIDGNFFYRPQKSHYWELGISSWFPWVRMHEQAFTFHSVVRVEKPYLSFASGKSMRRTEEGNYSVNETRLEKPVRWVAILAGKYHFEEETRNGMTVRVASFLMKNNQALKQLRNLAFQVVERYPLFLGPFPFDEMNIIEKNDFGYGQAPAGIVFITKEAFTPLMGEANDYVEGVNLRFLHEVAHMYWGSAVGMQSEEEQWLDEAFAEYSAALFVRGTNLASHYDRAVATWKVEAKDATKLASIPSANRLSHPGDAYREHVARMGLIYSKGAYLLTALHRELGDAVFITFLRSYQKNFHWKAGTTQDAISLLDYITKKSYAPWFERYYYGTELPELKSK